MIQALLLIIGLIALPIILGVMVYCAAVVALIKWAKGHL